jgi:flagellar assembly factor FliW
MDIATSRFGTVEVEPNDVIQFSAGLCGMENCRQWVLLADANNASLGWLQSVERPEVALAVVSPRRFVPNYQIRIARRDLTSLGVDSPEDAQVLVIVGRQDGRLVLNLKAPIVFNLARQIASQVVAKDDHPLQYALPPQGPPLRKSA